MFCNNSNIKFMAFINTFSINYFLKTHGNILTGKVLKQRKIEYG